MRKEIHEVKAAIFDMDGTLTDSMYIWDIAGETYLKSCGKTPSPNLREQLRPLSLEPVSYTHLDVYKRQVGIQVRSPYLAILEPAIISSHRSNLHFLNR